MRLENNGKVIPKKQVSLVSLNLFGCEIEDSSAILVFLDNDLRIKVAGQICDVPYSSIISIKKKLWYYQITWMQNKRTVEIKVSAFGLKPFIEELSRKLG